MLQLYQLTHPQKQLEHAVMKREAFNYDSFLWALTTVYARQNKILVAGANGKQVESLALIPFFDLINHEVHTTTYDG